MVLRPTKGDESRAPGITVGRAPSPARDPQVAQWPDRGSGADQGSAPQGT